MSKLINGITYWAFASDRELDLDLIQDIHPTFFFKPSGGLWLSPYIGESVSDWCSFCLNMHWENRIKYKYLITIKDSANVFEILKYDDLEALYDKYPSVYITNDMKTINKQCECCLDFYSMKTSGIDGLYVSDDIVHPLSTIHHKFPDNKIPNRVTDPWLQYQNMWAERPFRLPGWDIESLFVMNKDIIDSVRQL